ncbi:DNA-binding CsgD family transcriptional regulator [Sphingomonas zeicaulis]|uniref:helix-turn-helix transcriptional regulator n=1 Tax=Sphingomonas zeicaulis TaxID=1632740 RepID=UPI003D1E2921
MGIIGNGAAAGGSGVDSAMLALADRFADAAIDGAHWMPALAALASATGSAHGQLVGIGGPRAVPFNWVTGFSQAAIEQFIEIDGGDPLVNPRVAVSIGAPVLRVRSEADYRAVAPAMRNDVYADFARDHDIAYGCQAKLAEDDAGLIGLAVLRGERDGETTAEQRALFAAVAPHVRAAVRLQAALESQGLALVRGALDAVAAAVLFCDRDARIRVATPAAEALLGSRRLLSGDGRLAAVTRADTQVLRRAIADHGSAGPRRPAETLAIGTGEGRLPLLLDICAAPAGPWAFGFRPTVMVIARSERRWHASATTILSLLYGLSDAEADVALRLARGETREAIAEQRGTRLETVRAQLKTVFGKLGVRREVELVTMLADLLRS